MIGDDSKTVEFSTGVKRSASADHLDFTSLPIVGLIGVARTASEGATKYGRMNYLRGMPAWTCVNHAIRHLFMWCMGDRSEPHLEHAAWNCMAASQSMALNPGLNAAHTPGPGFSITPEIMAALEAGDAERTRRREAGEFLKEGEWQLKDLPEVQAVVAARAATVAAETKKSAGGAVSPVPYGWVWAKDGSLKNADRWEICKRHNADINKDMYVVVFPNGIPAGISRGGAYSVLEWENEEGAIAYVDAMTRLAA